MSKLEFAEALKARKRTLHRFDGMQFLGPGQKVIGAVQIRVPNKSEEIRARIQAATFLRGLMEKGIEPDDTLTEDARAAHILHVAVRDDKEPEAHSAWPAPVVMMDCLSNDEMGVLMNLVHSVIARESPTETSIDGDVLEKFISTLGGLGETAMADAVLASCDRDFLMQLCILMAMKLTEERAARVKADAADEPAPTEVSSD